jgi:hypothetical protein
VHDLCQTPFPNSSMFSSTYTTHSKSSIISMI